jgi:hypothetical protein
MTPADAPRFAKLLGALAETFDETLSTLRIEIYFRALADLDLDVVERAVTDAARTLTFFPRPAELRASVEGTPDDRAELAWMAVLQQVRAVGWCGAPVFRDSTIAQTVTDVFGGWRPLCERLPADGPELLMWAKQFKTVYGIHDKRATTDRLLPMQQVKGLLS